MGSAGESESGLCVRGVGGLNLPIEKSGLGSLEILKKILLLHSLSGTGCSSAW